MYNITTKWPPTEYQQNSAAEVGAVKNGRKTANSKKFTASSKKIADWSVSRMRTEEISQKQNGRDLVKLQFDRPTKARKASRKLTEITKIPGKRHPHRGKQ